MLVVLAVVTFSFEEIDPMFLSRTNIDDVYNFIEEWGSDYLLTYKVVINVSKSDTKAKLRLQLSQMLTRESNFKKLNAFIKSIKETSTSTNTKYDAKLIWGNFLVSKKELAEVAIALLSICPTEACVERSFSTLSNVHTKSRNKMKNKLIQAEMQIRWNSTYLFNTYLDEENEFDEDDYISE